MGCPSPRRHLRVAHASARRQLDHPSSTKRRSKTACSSLSRRRVLSGSVLAQPEPNREMIIIKKKRGNNNKKEKQKRVVAHRLVAVSRKTPVSRNRRNLLNAEKFPIYVPPALGVRLRSSASRIRTRCACVCVCVQYAKVGSRVGLYRRSRGRNSFPRLA